MQEQEEAAKEPDAIAGKKIFSAQHLGLLNAIQKEWGQAELCRGENSLLFYMLYIVYKWIFAIKKINW